MNSWRTAQSTVIGNSHIKADTECQDAHVVELVKDGQWAIAVVCDGAGSAPRSQEGASHVSRFIADTLVDLVAQFDSRAPGPWLNDYVIQKILEVREELRELAGDDDVKVLNCTLVACLVGPDGGFTFHIGDGNIVGGYENPNSPNAEIEVFHSLPENGEYANETYFITESDWVKHLRFKSVPALDWFLCCSDGGAALAMANEENLKLGFIVPVITQVFSSEDASTSSAKLSKYLSDPQADAVTGDDKTIVLACKPIVIEKMHKYFPEAERQSGNASSPKANSLIQKKRNNLKPFGDSNTPHSVFVLDGSSQRKKLAAITTLIFLLLIGLRMLPMAPFGSIGYDRIDYGNGKIYNGKVKDKTPNGIGVMSYADGSASFGNWTQEVRSGEIASRDPNGTISIEYWCNGQILEQNPPCNIGDVAQEEPLAE